MSKLGKIFLGIALAGALASIVAGYLVITKLNDTKTNLQQTATAKTVSDAEAKKQKGLAEAAATAEADANSKLTTANSNIDKLNGQLSDAQKASDAANAALTQAKTDADKAKADLDAINKTLNGQTPDALVAAKTKAEQDLAAAQDAQKILKDQYDQSQAQIAELKVDINNSQKSIERPGVSGKVTFVNRTWNFVVLDVGLANGVVPNGELIVFRKNNFLGKVKITSVETNSAVADIEPSVKGDIQVGDYVLN